MSNTLDKITTLWPEIVMLTGAVACLFTGLSSRQAARRATAGIAAAALVIAGVLAAAAGPQDATGLGLGGLTLYVKVAVAGVGLVLLMVAANLPEQLPQNQAAEALALKPGGFDPARFRGGEFFAFFLFSLTGVMLTAGAGELAWLFLALELTSLPTYVMVVTSRDRLEAPEAGVKYFFLGALGAAIFLYGFAFIYGATGFTDFPHIHDFAQAQIQATGSISPLMLTGLILAIIGICFKIAAVPMHFYAADVYQGAATPVTAFLAFVPKASGFVAIIVLLSLVGWPLDRTPHVVDAGDALVWVIWIIAALTMTLGNVLALLQDNVKRVLAYSSVAHSGYLLVGVLAGAGLTASAAAPNGAAGADLDDGIAAVLFYLVVYGLATVASFAVLGCLRARGEEAQTFDDLSGLARRHPMLGAIMAASVLSLLGVPPLVGFIGKVYLFTPAISAGFVGLVVIGVINSAVSAAYYLRIASVCFFREPTGDVELVEAPWRRVGAGVGALGVVVLFFAAAPLIDAAGGAAGPASPHAVASFKPSAEQSEAPDARSLVSGPSSSLNSSSRTGLNHGSP